MSLLVLWLCSACMCVFLVQEWGPSVSPSSMSTWRRRRWTSKGSQRSWCSSWLSGMSWNMRKRWRTVSSQRSLMFKTGRRSTASSRRRRRSLKLGRRRATQRKPLYQWVLYSYRQINETWIYVFLFIDKTLIFIFLCFRFSWHLSLNLVIYLLTLLHFSFFPLSASAWRDSHLSFRTASDKLLGVGAVKDRLLLSLFFSLLFTEDRHFKRNIILQPSSALSFQNH